ncbi:MAG TPA: acetyl-coenzyme A synthetase N-terminal domain-containing protein, partial [Polyangiales bacterium]|nr:acetyl-coenzyme A synthetase N-terminal domain-containing protein [Polyangiales bacterium]
MSESTMGQTHDNLWVPTAEWIENANVTRLMRKLGYRVDASKPDEVERTTREFVARTSREIRWFWDAALQDMDMLWAEPYRELLDTSRGNAYADWFIGGKTNIVSNCVDRHARGPNAQKLALIAESEDGTVQRWTF